MLYPISFASDNYAGCHPEVLEALQRVNHGHLGSYGHDIVTEQAETLFQQLLGEQVQVFFVLNGTAANVLGLSTLMRPHEAVICANTAHLQQDECGALERFAGSKVLLVNTPDAKIRPEALAPLMLRKTDVHSVQPRVLSITQSTEYGTVYSLEELRALCAEAHRLGLYVHLDGARVSNAAVSLGVELKELTADVGIDLMSFGGTKNGLMMGEAVVFFRPELVQHFEFVRKQGMQLASKMRFISAQFLALLSNDLWRRSARHANAMAQRLAAGMREIPGIQLTQPVQANAVFAIVPAPVIPRLQLRHHFYVWDERRHEVRWMTAFDTSEKDVDAFVEAARELMSSL